MVRCDATAPYSLCRALKQGSRKRKQKNGLSVAFEAHPACHQGPLPPSPLMGIFPTAVESALKATLKSLFMYSGFSPSAW